MSWKGTVKIYSLSGLKVQWLATMLREVFISYSSEDEAAASEVCRTLESRGIGCWIAPRDIVGGQTWAASIVGAIEECRILLVIVSSHANRSRQMSREVELADARKRRILPVRIENVTPRKDLEYFVGNKQWIDLFPPPIQLHANTLVNAVTELRDAETTHPDTTGTQIQIEHKLEKPRPTPPPIVGISPGQRWLMGSLAIVIVASAIFFYSNWMKSRDAYLEFLAEADQYSHAEMWLDAINWYDMALAKNPPAQARAQIYNLLCHANLQAKMVDEALGDCQRSIQLDSGRFKAHLDAGEVYQVMKQDDKAIAEFETALSIAKTQGDFAGQQIATGKINGLRK